MIFYSNKLKTQLYKFSKWVKILLCLSLNFPVAAQKIDTTQIFTLEKYMAWVRQYHPVIQQAGLLENEADAQLLKARGMLDPKWFGAYEDKSFDKKNYFRIGEAGLKIPLWFGADVKMGYLWSNGVFLNPENQLPTNGQAIVGVEVPVMQGLTFDKRRAQIQQARLLQDANAATRQAIVNDLLWNATKAYWKWAYQHQVVGIYQNSLRLAEERFRIVRESFLQGDKPAVDTLEAMIQIQNWSLELTEAEVFLENAKLELSNFLWFENMIPLEVTTNLRPESLENTWSLQEAQLEKNLFQNLLQSHPELRKIVVKQQQLDIKEKLQREQFKPNLRLNYNFLGNGVNFYDDNSGASPAANLVTENFKWGATFSYPLLLRKERGSLELVKIEQLETQLKLAEKQLKISNKIKTVLQQIETTFAQLQTFDAMIENYQRLLEAENEKFRFGESSIFLLNSREQKLIEAQLKQNKLLAKFQQLRWKLEWAKGSLE